MQRIKALVTQVVEKNRKLLFLKRKVHLQNLEIEKLEKEIKEIKVPEKKLEVIRKEQRIKEEIVSEDQEMETIIAEITNIQRVIQNEVTEISSATGKSIHAPALIEETIERPVKTADHHVEGAVEVMPDVEMEQIDKSNKHILEVLQQTLKSTTDSQSMTLIQTTISEITVIITEVEEILHKITIIEKEIYDHEMEIVLEETKEKSEVDPAKKALIEKRISEITKMVNEQKKEVLALIKKLNEKQALFQNKIENTAHKTVKKLPMPPKVKPRVYKKPKIHPLAEVKPGHTTPQDPVFVEEIEKSDQTIITEIQHIISTTRESVIKSYVEEHLKIVETLLKEVEKEATEIINLKKELVKIEEEIVRVEDQWAKTEDPKAKNNLAIKVEDLKKTKANKLQQVHKASMVINNTQKKVQTEVEMIARRSGQSLKMPPLVKEEKKPTKTRPRVHPKIVAIRRAEVKSFKNKPAPKKDADAIYKIPSMPPEQDCKCCKSYIKHTQKAMKKMKDQIKVLEEDSMRKGRVHDPNELVRQLRLKVKLLEDKNDELVKRHKKYIEEEFKRTGKRVCVIKKIDKNGNEVDGKKSKTSPKKKKIVKKTTEEFVIVPDKRITELHIRPKKRKSNKKLIKKRNKLAIPEDKKNSTAIDYNKPIPHKKKQKKLVHKTHKLKDNSVLTNSTKKATVPKPKKYKKRPKNFVSKRRQATESGVKKPIVSLPVPSSPSNKSKPVQKQRLLDLTEEAHLSHFSSQHI
jgi:hypothetical protein